MEHQIPVTSMEQEQPDTKPAAQLEIPDQLREIGDRVSEAYEEFRKSETYDRLMESKESASEYIRKNPLAACGYALGAGVLLGFILKRSR